MIRTFLTLLLFMNTVFAGAPPLQESSGGETFAGPASPAVRDAWLAALQQWRTDQRAQMKYDDSLYARPELAWTQHSFIQSLLMCEDRYFYDPAARKYTVDRYLNDLDTRYGGLDSVLVWPVYPNAGIDNRNQHDLLRDMPGGLDGVRGMVEDFHRLGVQVLFPMMPWENGLRQEDVPLAEAVARDFKTAGIDGVNGDTMNGIPKQFLDAASAQGHLLAFEPELAMPLEDVQWDPLGWGYWTHPAVPVLDRYKWLEPRHLTHVCDRWSKDHTDDLQAAFLNGDGFESWENIWGIWNGLTPHDTEALRRIATVERGLADYLTSPDWEPHVATLQPGVYASMFPTSDGTVWLLVNRSGADLTNAQIAVSAPPNAVFYDIWHGTILGPLTSGATATLSFDLDRDGFGAVLMRTTETLPDTIKTLLATMNTLAQRRLTAFSHKWRPLPQAQVPIERTAPTLQTPDGMVEIPGVNYHFKVSGVEIEGWGCPPGPDQTGVDVQYPWESAPTRGHEHDVSIRAFYIDKYPVTNEQFKAFLSATQYHPADDHNFLRDWTNGTFPAGWARKPVTWVSIEDARAYAAWAGKRLPYEWEWQFAAQGTDGRPYPWGTAPDAAAVPVPDTGPELTGPADVDAHPKGASLFGVMDLVGNVWQWTNEYTDEHTRAAIVRGDSYYQPRGSMWYFSRNPTLGVHGKYLLMCPGMDRAGTIGFRCVKDE
jgi:iron(II)-dependent oxidoreductase